MAIPTLEALEGDTSEQGHILLVEDNAINTFLVMTLLNKAGYTVECATNGAEAVEMAAARAFDLILMDIQMPVMDGLEATRRIKALGGWPASTPIVAVTANVMQDDIEACIKVGMYDFISKPIEVAGFLGVVGRTLTREAA